MNFFGTTGGSAPGVIYTCACCGEQHHSAQATFDEDLQGAVCEDCRKQLRGAQAWLGIGLVRMPPSLGDELLPVRIRGVYRGEDAGDNCWRPIKP
jgi:DNA-directed RNA polymerase subunit RPC12/RpoP